MFGAVPFSNDVFLRRLLCDRLLVGTSPVERKCTPVDASQACRGTDRIREIEGVRASLVTRRRKEEEEKRTKNAHVVFLMTLRVRMMMTTLFGKTLAAVVVVLPLNENVIKDHIRTSMTVVNTGQSLVFSPSFSFTNKAIPKSNGRKSTLSDGV